MKKQLLLMFLLCANMSFAQNIEKYTFPMMPGDDEWKAISHPKRLKVLNIEQEELKNLSNIQLIGACHDYPYTINIFAFNNYDEGYLNVYNNFNGLRELHRRSNIGEDLVDFYSNMSTGGFKVKYMLYNKYFNQLKLVFFEVLLTKEDILTKFTNNQKQKLVEACVEKYYEKEKNTRTFEGEAIFSNSNKKLSLVIACRLILLDGDEKNKISAIQFLKSDTFNKDAIENIILISRNLY